MKAKYAPGERNTRLGRLPPKDLPAVLGHRMHQRNFVYIQSLIARLRNLRASSDYYEFHNDLVAFMYGADEWRDQCAKVELLLRDGADCDPSWRTVDWRLERIVADRVCRQLRCVGDGLAWKALAYERPLIVALGTNRSNPSLSSKKGFACELRVLKDTWENEGHFAMLHDVTNCLTVGDLTICSQMHAPWVDRAKHTCNPERWVVAEVKNRNGKCMTVRRGKQLDRMQMVVDAVVNGTALVGDDGVPRQLFRSTRQLKTHLRRVAAILEEASNSGHSTRRIQRNWVLSGRAPAQALKSGLSQKDLKTTDDRALIEAGFTEGRPRFLLSSADILGLSRGCAPFSIFPFSPEICAALTCDYLAFLSVLEVTAVDDALLAAGFEQVQEITPIDLSQGDRPVVRGLVKGKAMSINGAGLNQIMLESVDIKRQAEAMIEYCSRPDATPAIGVLTLKNERATWR
jgi:hypothetical protein